MTHWTQHGLVLASLALGACIQSSDVPTDAATAETRQLGLPDGAAGSDTSTANSKDGGEDSALAPDDASASDSQHCGVDSALAPDDTSASDSRNSGRDPALAPGDTIVVKTPAQWCGPNDCNLCDDAVVALDVTGETPMGVFHAERATLEYVSGLSQSATVNVSGTLADRKVVLHVGWGDSWDVGEARCYTARSTDDRQGAGREQASVSLSDGSVIRHASGSFSGIGWFLAATVTIEEHVFGATGPSPHPTTRLRGTVEIDEPGWSLRVPFEFDRACDFTVLAI